MRSRWLMLAAAVLAGCASNAADPDTAEQSSPPRTCQPAQSLPFDQRDGRPHPLRSDLPLHEGTPGRVEVSGLILDESCEPASDVLVLFSSAGLDGYTPDSFGSVETGADGTYRFSAPFPSSYSGTPHIHVSARRGEVEVRGDINPEVGVFKYTVDFVMPSSNEPQPSGDPSPSDDQPSSNQAP